jgi:hypothetical protein
MKYIGNFADWIKPEWMEEVMSKPGFDMPKHSIRNEARFNPILKSYFKEVDRITTQDEFNQIVKDLDQMDPNDKNVIHAKIHVDYLDPNRVLDDEYAMYENAGYDVWATHFKLLEKFDVSFNILDNPPPFLDYKDKHITWWFSKMNPGHIMPMHIDRASPDVEVHKYWMPWTEYQLGHIFMCEDKVITNYKLGDVWMFENPGAWHGAVNIGHTPRAVLQITDYKPSRNLNEISS